MERSRRKSVDGVQYLLSLSSIQEEQSAVHLREAAASQYFGFKGLCQN